MAQNLHSVGPDKKNKTIYFIFKDNYMNKLSLKYLVWRMLAIAMVSSITPFAEHKLVRISCSTADLRNLKTQWGRFKKARHTYLVLRAKGTVSSTYNTKQQQSLLYQWLSEERQRVENSNATDITNKKIRNWKQTQLTSQTRHEGQFHELQWNKSVTYTAIRQWRSSKPGKEQRRIEWSTSMLSPRL